MPNVFRPTRATVLAMIFSFGSIIYVFYTDFTGDASPGLSNNTTIFSVTFDTTSSSFSQIGVDFDALSETTSRILGNFLALGATVFVATYFVLGRKRCLHTKQQALAGEIVKEDEIDPLTYNILAGPIVMIVSVLLGARLHSVTDNFFSLDVLYIFVGGFFWVTIGFGLLTYSTRFIPTPVVGLLMLLETVLGPVWAYIFLDEEPSQQALIGGVMLCLVLIIYNSYLLGCGAKAMLEKVDKERDGGSKEETITETMPEKDEKQKAAEQKPDLA